MKLNNKYKLKNLTTRTNLLLQLTDGVANGKIVATNKNTVIILNMSP